MFRTLLSTTAARMLDVSIASVEDAPVTLSVSDGDEDTTISLNVDALYAWLPPAAPWRRMAALCGHTLAALGEEVESVARMLAALEGDCDGEQSGGGAGEGSPSRYADESCEGDRAPGAQNWDVDGGGALEVWMPHDGPLLIRNADASIPTIVITPCEPAPPPSWVPLQDACFGNRLVVPAHPVVNEVFPPLLARPLPLSLARYWEYAGGHWRAVLPSTEEQIRRGLFARMPVRRRMRLRRT